MTAVDVISGVLLGAGALFALSGAVGLLRFPDFFARTHAAGITDTAGAGLILIGLLLQCETLGVAVRVVLILLFLLFTSPTAAHALAQAALRDGLRPLLKRPNAG